MRALPFKCLFDKVGSRAEGKGNRNSKLPRQDVILEVVVFFDLILIRVITTVDEGGYASK